MREVTASPAQGGVIGNGESKPEQMEDAADEALGLTQGQVVDEPQHQHELDCEVRVAGLTAWRGPSRG